MSFLSKRKELILVHDGSNYVYLRVGPDGNLFVSPSGGYVGFGTSSPERRVELFHGSEPQLRLTQGPGKYVDCQVGNGGVLTLLPIGNQVRINSTYIAPVADNDIAGKKYVDDSSARKVTIVSTATYTILPTDSVIVVDYTGTAPVTLTLPAASAAWNASSSSGFSFIVKDSGANASVNSITINRAGADTIVSDLVGQTTVIIGGDGDTITFQAKDASTWITY